MSEVESEVLGILLEGEKSKTPSTIPGNKIKWLIDQGVSKRKREYKRGKGVWEIYFL